MANEADRIHLYIYEIYVHLMVISLYVWHEDKQSVYSFLVSVEWKKKHLTQLYYKQTTIKYLNGFIGPNLICLRSLIEHRRVVYNL